MIYQHCHTKKFYFFIFLFFAIHSCFSPLSNGKDHSKDKSDEKLIHSSYYKVIDRKTNKQVMYAGSFSMYAYLDSTTAVVGYELDEKSFNEELQKVLNNRNLGQPKPKNLLLVSELNYMHDSVAVRFENQSTISKLKRSNDSTLIGKKILLRKVSSSLFTTN